MGKKTTQKRGLFGALKNAIAGDKVPAQPANRKRARRIGEQPVKRRDLLAPYQPSTLDLDPHVHPTKHHHPKTPDTLSPGTLLVSGHD